jgi:hypothetical protein
VSSEIGAALLNGALEFVCTDLLDPSEKFAKSLLSSSTKSVQADGSIQVKITMTHEEIAEIPGNRHEWRGNFRGSQLQPPGVMAMACTHRRPDATRETRAVIAVGINRQLARNRPGRMGLAERSVIPRKPGNSGGEKGQRRT